MKNESAVIEYHPHQQRFYVPQAEKTFHNESLCIPRSFLAIYSTPVL